MIYQHEIKQSHTEHCRTSDNVYTSVVKELSLPEYLAACSHYCHSKHRQPCSKCQALLEVGHEVLNGGYCVLSGAFRAAFPHTKYTAERGRRSFLQMPLVALRIGNPCDGNAYTILMEKYQGVNYTKISHVLEALASSSHVNPTNLSKECAKMLLSLARSDRERETLRYAIFKSSGISQSEARCRFGFESMSKRAEKVEQETERIRVAVDDLAKAQDKAMLLRVFRIT